jgi:cytochrome P450
LILWALVRQLLSIAALSLIPFFEVAMARLALRPFTFSNGVIIPAGTLIAVPSSAIHMDEEIYSNPERFDGFRFSKLSGCNRNGDVTMTGHSAVSISPKHLAFGLGRHAW